MRTAVPGTFSVSSFVASSPSMPGIRTSMITTSGFRRSASATALAPSAASPMTRMWSARESDSRKPSRTTSWSSTIRQVISGLPSELASSGTAKGLYSGNQTASASCSGFCSGSSAHAAIRHAEFASEGRDLQSHGLRFVGPEVSPPAIELLVVRNELGPVLSEVLEEVLAGARAEEEQVCPDPRRAGLARGLDDFGELLGPVGDAGEDGEFDHPSRAAWARLLAGRGSP
jgi:hypothetical protein